MKSTYFSPLVWLLVAALFFTGAYLSSYYTQRSGPLLQADALRLQSLLSEAELTASSEVDSIVGQLSRHDLNFEALVREATYPSFVYRGNKLLYWSDHTTRSEPENVHPSYQEKFAETRFGQFLVLRRARGLYTVLTYVPLKRQYGISNRYLRNEGEQSLFGGPGHPARAQRHRLAPAAPARRRRALPVLRRKPAAQPHYRQILAVQLVAPWLRVLRGGVATAGHRVVRRGQHLARGAGHRAAALRFSAGAAVRGPAVFGD